MGEVGTFAFDVSCIEVCMAHECIPLGGIWGTKREMKSNAEQFTVCFSPVRVSVYQYVTCCPSYAVR